MSSISREEYEFGMLILEALEGTISKERFAELEKKINADPAAAKQYLDQVMNQAVLMWRGESLHADTDIVESPEDTKFLCAMGEYEKSAPAVETKLIDTQARPVDEVIKPARAARQINKFTLVTAITSLAALVFLMAYVYLNPAGRHETVAAITDSVHAVWGDSHVGSDVRLTEQTGPLELKSGYIKIVYDYGTEVVLEGPTKFEVLGPEEMFVTRGQVYARAPSSAIGFTISTPHSKIIDLGTEFGVKVGDDGATDVHMIKGKASLIAGQKGYTKLNEIVHEGIAKQVDSQERMKDIQLQENIFARQISSETGIIWRGENVNLADLVAGGNGLGQGAIGKGISLSTGQCVSGIAEQINDGQNTGYVSVPQIKQIDGIFVPSGGKNKVIISSTGKLFENCPAVSGKSFSGIYTGRAFQAGANEYFSMLPQDGQSETAAKPAICIYGNAGITFDLDTIRQSIPQSRIRAFHAVCGLSPDTAGNRLRTGNSQADVFVLVDGKVSFETLAISRFSQQKKIDIPIRPTDRFLTLVGTDGGEVLGSDWILFSEPYLELSLED
jgi:hypothetical protein